MIAIVVPVPAMTAVGIACDGVSCEPTDHRSGDNAAETSMGYGTTHRAATDGAQNGACCVVPVATIRALCGRAYAAQHNRGDDESSCDPVRHDVLHTN